MKKLHLLEQGEKAPQTTFYWIVNSDGELINRPKSVFWYSGSTPYQLPEGQYWGYDPLMFSGGSRND